MNEKRTDVLYGSLGLIILKTLEALGPLHGYRIARRIEQISGDHLTLNQGTLYPALVRLEQRGWIKGTWRQTETRREAKYYTITAAGRRAVEDQAARWRRLSALVNKLLIDEG